MEIDNLVHVVGDPDQQNENVFIQQENFRHQDSDSQSDDSATDEAESDDDDELPIQLDDVDDNPNVEEIVVRINKIINNNCSLIILQI